MLRIGLLMAMVLQGTQLMHLLLLKLWVLITLPAGRFKLYPTTNKYNFILQDATDGRIWQVQWGLDTADRQVIRIMNWQSDDF